MWAEMRNRSSVLKGLNDSSLDISQKDHVMSGVTWTQVRVQISSSEAEGSKIMKQH